MKKIFMLIILVLMVTNESYGIEEPVIKNDFNADGYVDILKSYYDGGSMFGGDFIYLKDGKTKKRYEYNSFGSFGQFLRLIPFDNLLLKPDKKGFKEAIEKVLFPNIKYKELDASLDWLIQANINNQTDLKNELFSQRISFPPKWIRGEIVIDGSYYTIISDPKLFKRYPIYDERNPRYDQRHRQGWLVYYGENHVDLTLVSTSKDYSIYKTAHGVILRKGNQYCWIFINDEVLMDGPAKLTQPSINKVIFSNDLVFIHHMGGEEHLFIVDFNKGIVGRVKDKIFPGIETDFEIADNQLIIKSESKTIKIDLRKVKNNLQ
jgi:hypothetical protein